MDCHLLKDVGCVFPCISGPKSSKCPARAKPLEGAFYKTTNNASRFEKMTRGGRTRRPRGRLSFWILGALCPLCTMGRCGTLTEPRVEILLMPWHRFWLDRWCGAGARALTSQTPPPCGPASFFVTRAHVSRALDRRAGYLGVDCSKP